eukprot:5115455-Prymnesium_polylepis.1
MLQDTIVVFWSEWSRGCDNRREVRQPTRGAGRIIRLLCIPNGAAVSAPRQPSLHWLCSSDEPQGEGGVALRTLN